MWQIDIIPSLTYASEPDLIKIIELHIPIDYTRISPESKNAEMIQ